MCITVKLKFNKAHLIRCKLIIYNKNVNVINVTNLFFTIMKFLTLLLLFVGLAKFTIYLLLDFDCYNTTIF